LETSTPPSGPKSIVLVGLMGAGKSTVGRRLAAALGRPFVDADSEIEKAAGQSVADIFETYGEEAFRSGERRVIARLLGEGPVVLATGGGAFMDEETRKLVKQHAVSIWLRADIEVLMKRVSKRDTRPLLRVEDPRKVMEQLIKERYPFYEQADIEIESEDGPHESTVRRAITALEEFAREENSAT